MNDRKPPVPPNNAGQPQPPGSMRSPIRPTTPPPASPLPVPSAPAQPTPAAPPPAPQRPPEGLGDNPSAALNSLRQKMETIADEFGKGKINRAQFYAIYNRYREQRAIVERMLEKNPDSNAWKQVIGVKGHTGFLRSHYEAQPIYFVIYQHNSTEPILFGGKDKPAFDDVLPIVQLVWKMPSRPKAGLGRRQLTSGTWMILATGEHAATAVAFTQEPSTSQARLVRDLHADFERANQAALARGWIFQERMVFPQRALVETTP